MRRPAQARAAAEGVAGAGATAAVAREGARRGTVKPLPTEGAGTAPRKEEACHLGGAAAATWPAAPRVATRAAGAASVVLATGTPAMASLRAARAPFVVVGPAGPS